VPNIFQFRVNYTAEHLSIRCSDL